MTEEENAAEEKSMASEIKTKVAALVGEVLEKMGGD